jgi:predicted XRE-type DNA-binding protein
MILLHGFVKKTRKMPKDDLKLARQHKSDMRSTVSSRIRNSSRTGSRFDSFLEGEHLFAEALAIAQKRVIAWQLKEGMNRRHVSKQQLAKQLRTSRSQINRLLDPEYVGVSISNVTKALSAVGKRLSVQIFDSRSKTAGPIRA